MPLDLFENAGMPAPQGGMASPPRDLLAPEGMPQANPNAMGLQDQVLRAMTFGLSDKAAALAHTRPLTRAYDAITGGNHVGSFSDLYHEGLSQARQAGEQYASDNPILSKMATGFGTLAAVPASTVIPKTLGGLMGQGAKLGGLSGFGNSDDQSVMSTLGSTLFGSTIGGGIGGAFGLGSRIASPQTSSAVREVIDAGGKPTLGQIAGLKGAEETAGKFPFMTGAVNAGRDEANQSFVRATVDKSLAPIGEKVASDTPVGHAMIAEAQQKVGSVYDRVAKTAQVPIDPAIDFAAARANVPASQLPEFDRAIQQQVTDRLKGGVLSGNAWRSAREELGSLSETYSTKGTAQEEMLSNALDRAQDVLHNALAKANPAAAQDIANANASYAQLLRAKRAAAYLDAGKSGGIFTPDQYLAAVKAKGGESAFSQGKALGQDWALSARRALGNGESVKGLMQGENPHPLGYAMAFPVGAAARGIYSPAQALTQYLARTNRPTSPIAAQALNRLAPAMAAQQGGSVAPGLINSMAWQ